MTTTPADDDRYVDPRVEAAEQVEQLARSNARSNETLVQLVDKVREDAAMRERKVELLERGHRQNRKLFALLGVVLVVLIGIGVVNAVNIGDARRNAAVTAEAAKNAGDTYRLLYGCFDPNSQCSKLNAEQQKRILDEIKVYQLTVAYCLRVNPAAADPNADEFMACVNRLYPDGPQLKGR